MRQDDAKSGALQSQGSRRCRKGCVATGVLREKRSLKARLSELFPQRDWRLPPGSRSGPPALRVGPPRTFARGPICDWGAPWRPAAARAEAGTQEPGQRGAGRLGRCPARLHPGEGGTSLTDRRARGPPGPGGDGRRPEETGCPGRDGGGVSGSRGGVPRRGRPGDGARPTTPAAPLRSSATAPGPRSGSRATPDRRCDHHRTYRTTGTLASPRPLRARLLSRAPERYSHWLALARAVVTAPRATQPPPPRLRPFRRRARPCHLPEIGNQWIALTPEPWAGPRPAVTQTSAGRGVRAWERSAR